MALFVGRLALDTHPRDLEHIFDKYGRLNRLEIKRGYAFVEYMDTRDASDALKETDGMRVRGNRIVVEWAKNGGKKPGMSAYGKARVIGQKTVVRILLDLIIDIVAGALEEVTSVLRVYSKLVLLCQQQDMLAHFDSRFPRPVIIYWSYSSDSLDVTYLPLVEISLPNSPSQ
ncbi:7318_t:CDS:2 [Ambispora leptoticha]|uniref:7318_t:CDS:1 n=1 Tax=Ambispora leptoticha TaxID=144679 RepID=A0A9N9AIQ8_9GLOM|nr:7318_t:CDS:2 [Ambispora leptoticha]